MINLTVIKLWEPYDMRVSRTVLRGVGGAIPPVYSLFFAQSRSFLEEMYRTLRKYKAGIVSITQNLADYGDDAFAKMIFTNSFTKIFLQNGAAAEYLKNTFDLPETDIQRVLSVTSKKPLYSEFFVLTPVMSQIFRLYPTQEFYDLANTENISINQ